MTGFGEAHATGRRLGRGGRSAHHQQPVLQVLDALQRRLSALEPQIESVVREQIKRGTVQVTLRVDRSTSPDDYSLNSAVLEAYRRQFMSCNNAGSAERVMCRWRALLALPGVVNEQPSRSRECRQRGLAADRAHAGGGACRTWRKCARMKAGRWPPICKANCRVDRKRAEADRRAGAVGGRSLSHAAGRAADEALAEHQRHAQSGRSGSRSEHLCRAQRHFRGNRAAAEPPGAVSTQSWPADESAGRKLEFLTQEMFREQHHRLEKQRRRDRPARDRNQGDDRAIARNDPECGVRRLKANAANTQDARTSCFLCFVTD